MFDDSQPPTGPLSEGQKDELLAHHGALVSLAWIVVGAVFIVVALAVFAAHMGAPE